ncbi:winged helix-turn-helix domain-containing protein [Streptomyces sp. G-G2]|uniref:winged helix-turn-helix domain-containing protein n=1 Tax=Streptomyces sp. G-G2 TaxID=3046201 RepID=UPI0024BA487C|nr:winged helix-turn-helix domain-containing protein [Streptomyces sp. G-G2]MDJ0382442.1 winged helix-turn-helix domain-containing protein [Streptomyces sp. G-G2]
MWRLLKRHGWSGQALARRALEGDEHAVELWKRKVWKQQVWPEIKACGAPRGWMVFEDEAGFSMTPPRARGPPHR